ncbi:MAG: hypothetical protein QNJ88_01210 [Acidimicrobiia bacterium]|nr:hypothetical protein [Acidimicrobiia bacterium]
MTGFDHLGLLGRVDDLYESVVMQPDRWTDDMFGDWATEAVSGAPPSKLVARELRRCLRMALRLRDFWMEDLDRPDDHGDWRTRIDLALGPRAWRPSLAIAQIGLEEAPSEELFEEVRERFRVVNNDRWMEEVTFFEWLAEHGRRGTTADGDEG